MHNSSSLALVLAVAASSPSVAQAGECRPVSAVACGLESTYAITAGAVHAWGGNSDGILGNGEKSAQELTPIAVPGLASGTTQVSTKGGTSCALAGGAVKCWGLNSFGQVGNGKSSDSDHRVLAPVATAITSGATQLAVGTDFNCAIVSGGVKCWGSRFSKVAMALDGLESGVTLLSIGWQGVYGWGCAVASGGVKCWEDGGKPATPHGLSSGIASIAVGESFACVLGIKGGVRCWGNRFGIADGSGEAAKSPVDARGLTKGVTAIAAAAMYACAIVDGGVKCWGDTPFGMRTSPEDAPGLDAHIASISLGSHHLCAVTANGQLKCLGQNTMGELGNGTTEESALANDVCVR